jgi:hypothetical protein
MKLFDLAYYTLDISNISGGSIHFRLTIFIFLQNNIGTQRCTEGQRYAMRVLISEIVYRYNIDKCMGITIDGVWIGDLIYWNL